MSRRSRLRGAAIAAFLAGRQRLPIGRRGELWFQPDDPYSYLLAQHLDALRERYGVRVDVRVLLDPDPAANPEPERRLAYAIADCAELARYYEVDFPADARPPTREAVRRAAAAVMAGEHPRAVGAALWAGEPLPDAPIDTVRRAQRGADELKRRGHYMGGMLRFGRHWFWGVDRLEHLERRLGGEPSLLRARPRSEWPSPGPEAPLELWFSFRSPYSYLALERTLELPADLRIRPVLPMVMRGLRVPAAKRMYIVHDCKREADRLGVPFGRICDPLGAGIERCLAIYRLADAEGRAGDFLRSAARGIWSEALDVADDADLRTVVERAGLAWADAREAIADPAWEAMAEENRQALYDAGLWGVPSYRLGEYTTWGQDRIEILRAKLPAVRS